MKRLAIAAGAALLGSAGAMAAECVNPNPAYSPAETKISVLFDEFRAVVDDIATCSLAIDAHQVSNDPDLFEVYAVDVRGFVGPEDDDEAQITVDANGRTHTATIPGNGVDTEVLSFYQGKEADGTLRSETTLEVTNDVDDSDDTLADIDSFDYALAGTMTREDAEDSLASVGQGQVALATHLDASSGLLTGSNLALEGDDEFRFFGGVGSFMVGGNVRYNLGDGFSLMGGLSIVDQSAAGAEYRGVLGAATLRFVQPGGAFFGDAGVNAGVLSTSFSRSYSATPTDAALGNDIDIDNDVVVGVPNVFDVSGTGTAGLGAIYLRGGIVVPLDQVGTLVLSSTIKQTVLGIGAYQEDVSINNLFAADLSGQLLGFTTAKVAADLTAALATDLDLTANLGLGTTIANQATSAYIMGGGDVTGEVASTVFVEYGAGLTYHLSPDSAVEGFVQGSTGTGIGTHAQIGAAYRMSF